MRRAVYQRVPHTACKEIISKNIQKNKYIPNIVNVLPNSLIAILSAAVAWKG